MRFILFFILSISILFATQIKLTEKQANFIAQKVWQNEGAGLDKYLVHWNEGEDFASVGIGHFIWFSKGHMERFREVFPMVVASMEEKGVKMPSWLNSKTPLPWNSKEEFYAAKKAKSKKYVQLFKFLKATMPEQADFMAQRLSAALSQMLETIEEPEKQQLIKKRFYEVMHNKDGSVNERGLYVLLDYTNFKGEGTLKSERYKGEGWGLLQVLEHMNPKEANKLKAFAESAKAMLSRRIKNSPPARGEERWRKGWNVRLDTYWK
ncbi:MAG: hypothetical protein WBM70_04170 [Sulfurovum sp.]|jgi:hypothetical protein|uniref:hypothetical protein n=1 Tax=Sulfurovum sp. TaxID=1969726 RepID=UPI003C731758